MPGHKRNSDFGIIGADIDITEIDGFDNLHRPESILSELEKRTADIYGSKKVFYPLTAQHAVFSLQYQQFAKRVTQLSSQETVTNQFTMRALLTSLTQFILSLSFALSSGYIQNSHKKLLILL